MYRIYISIICFVLTITGSLNAQLVTTHYGLQEGLPSSETFFGYQDDSNYLWFTTDRGVVKFDGYEFKTFTTNNGLAELVNLKILKDPAGGFIVVGKSSNITFYKKGKFEPFRFNQKLKEQHKSIEDRLDILDISKEKILLNDLANVNRTFLEIDRNTGEIITYSISDIGKINWSSVSQLPFEGENLISDTIRIIRCPGANNDQYIVSINKDYFFYSIGAEEVMETPIPKYTFFSFLDESNYLWYNQPGHLILKGPNGNSKTILDQEISSIIKDHDGNIWAMTPGEGIYKIKYNTFIDRLNVLGFDGRVVDIYTQDNLMKIYTISRGNNYKYYMQDSILYSDFNKTAYIIKAQSIQDSFKLAENFTFRNIDTTLSKISKVYDYSILINYVLDKSRFVYEKNGDIIIHNNRAKNSIKQDLPYTYDFIKNGDIYLFGTSEGLKTGQFDKNDQHLLITDTTYINSRINDLDKGLNDDAWIATLEKGLYRYHDGAIKEVVNPYHPLTSINSIEVLDSVAFIGSSTGVIKIRYEIVDDSVIIKRSEILGISGGLSPPYVKSLEFYQDNIYMGTLQGIYSFHVDSFKLTESKPKMYLQGLYQKNKKITSENPLSYEFGSQNNFFTIKYTGISFAKDPVIPFYRYSFQSNDSTQWIYTHSRELNFSDLAPGNYKFVVQCRNNANEWSDPASLFVNIQPPFFQTWTFRIGSLLILGGFIWTFFHFRNRRLKRQQAMKNEILTVQMQSTRSQMNPHFVFNGMNAIQNFIFSNDKEGANRYITTFSSLLRDSLQMANREYISLDREIRFVDRYLSLEKNRFPDKFDYKITVSTDIPEEKVLVPTLMVQTLAENAVKHAFKGVEEKGVINIHYHYNSLLKQLTIKIVDDGIGLLNSSFDNKTDDDSSRFGLNLLRRRIDIYNERIPDNNKATVIIDYLDPEKKTGTKISLKIPLYENGN